MAGDVPHRGSAWQDDSFEAPRLPRAPASRPAEGIQTQAIDPKTRGSAGFVGSRAVRCSLVTVCRNRWMTHFPGWVGSAGEWTHSVCDLWVLLRPSLWLGSSAVQSLRGHRPQLQQGPDRAGSEKFLRPHSFGFISGLLYSPSSGFVISRRFREPADFFSDSGHLWVF